jgi:hypothetical protein
MNSAKNFDWKVYGEAFVHQTERFEELLQTDPQKLYISSKLALPRTVLSFAEDLMLCQTEAAAASHIEQDREAARGCWIVADELASATGKERNQFSVSLGATQTPFRLLAAIAIARCQLAIERNGDSWVHHSDSPKYSVKV